MTILIVDAHNIFHRGFHSHQGLSRSDGTLIGGVYGALKIMWPHLVDGDYSHVAFTWDTGARNFRHDLLPTYKGNRGKSRPPEFTSQIRLFKAACERLGGVLEAAEGYEADDMVASLAQVATNSVLDVDILSNDKDMLQLVRPGVAVITQEIYSHVRRTRVLRSAEDVEAAWGIRPDQVVDYLAIVGDVADNVPGVPGIGDVGARALLSAHDTLDGILANLDKIRGRYRVLFESHGDRARGAVKLIRLCREVPVPPLDAFYRGPTWRERVLEICEEHEFKSLAAKIGAYAA